VIKTAVGIDHFMCYAYDVWLSPSRKEGRKDLGEAEGYML
jgi:hypothetical protein